MIIEGVCTTINPDGTVNVAPMGPVTDAALSAFRFRPFRSSQTYQNLKRTGQGVFHVTDDVLLIARAIVGDASSLPETLPAVAVNGRVLADACRWFEFEVTSLDDSQDRTEIETRILHAGRLRDFFGFNRAKHAVLEAAILATRLHLLDRQDVCRQLAALRIIVDKTAGDQEREAFGLIEREVGRRLKVES